MDNSIDEFYSHALKMVLARYSSHERTKRSSALDELMNLRIAQLFQSEEALLTRIQRLSPNRLLKKLSRLNNDKIYNALHTAHFFGYLPKEED